MPSYAENIPVDERERFERFGQEMRALQKLAAQKRGSTKRALHVKQHLAATGSLVVGEVPAHLRVAVFSEPKTWPVFVRFSNGSARRQGDATPDARGLAVKLTGVPGKKIIPGLEDKKTQDFLFVAEPALAFRTPDEFMTFVRIASKGGSPALLPLKLLSAFGFGRGLSVLGKLAKLPKVASMATHPFFTAAPIRFGDTAAKLALFPSDKNGGDVGHDQGADQLRADLVARLARGPLEWSVRVQLFENERTTPIEDVSVEWKTPFTEIAKLVLPQQQASSELDERVDAMSFDPWHAVEELRPLGAMMRARAVAYRESVIERGAAAEPE